MGEKHYTILLYGSFFTQKDQNVEEEKQMNNRLNGMSFEHAFAKKLHEEGFWVKETIQGLGREVSLEEQEEKGPWIKLCQIGDCGLSLQNVLKWLG